MKHFIQIHILSGLLQRASWHVACEGTWLAQVLLNHRTHNIQCRTTGHLEDIIGTVRQKLGVGVVVVGEGVGGAEGRGYILRSSEL